MTALDSLSTLASVEHRAQLHSFRRLLGAPKIDAARRCLASIEHWGRRQRFMLGTRACRRTGKCRWSSGCGIRLRGCCSSRRRCTCRLACEAELLFCNHFFDALDKFPAFHPLQKQVQLVVRGDVLVHNVPIELLPRVFSQQPV